MGTDASKRSVIHTGEADDKLRKQYEKQRADDAERQAQQRMDELPDAAEGALLPKDQS